MQVVAPNMLDTNSFSWEPEIRRLGAGAYLDAAGSQSFRHALHCLASIWSEAFRWMTAIAFETVIDDSLSTITNVVQLKAMLNKRLLSLVNDFEDGKWRSSRFQSYKGIIIIYFCLNHSG